MNTLTRKSNKRRATNGKRTVCYGFTNDAVHWGRTCTGYRLPTEAEWEYAARAGTQTAFSFEENPTKLIDYAWYSYNCKGRLHSVGTKKPNQ